MIWWFYAENWTLSISTGCTLMGWVWTMLSKYKAPSREKSLSELIVNYPEPIKKIIRKTGRRPVTVYSKGTLKTVKIALT
jgi:hypothetical protein